eukprot:NODE_101_length_2309_cov_86.545371_g80_i0.p1 GENE.NODE_101_length_2309_cov_86.545371_g80_i0~~NODE_101_length_2309_cov_86.545371_g80_i0.p1  ORF type:complete len:654 (+),score=140.80 NODE_101_length_2309_cov_86.545371_g80_i0:177-2138(+)
MEIRLPERHLELASVIGFGGQVPGGLSIHPDGKHLVYPLGSCVMIRRIGSDTKAEKFLLGHTDRVSCVTVSKSGNLIASGQITHMGFQADICVFDYHTLKLVHRMTLHKVKVQALCFSADEKFLASLGGQDDNSLVVWDLETGRPVCGGSASSDLSMAVAFYNKNSAQLVTAGHMTFRVWEIDYANRKINPSDVDLGNLQRIGRCIVIEPDDRFAFVGTTSGDVLCVQLQGAKLFKFAGPSKCLASGILCCSLTASGDLLVGSGGGEVAKLAGGTLKKMNSVSLSGMITSVAAKGDHYFVGTNKSNVYYLNAKTFKEELRQTCHYERINDIAFPRGFSQLFATCSNNDIRIWNAGTSQELLRIQVQQLECNCVAFSPDGRTVVSGWSDGKVRAFGPQTGKLLYVINDAHKLYGMKRISGNLQGVTALAITSDSARIITGGADSQVRAWQIGQGSQMMIASLKEHKATVNCIALRAGDTHCVTASDDGSCIVWDLTRMIRANIMYAQTYFRAVDYFPDESQILTCGSDRKITYWDSYECSAIRELEGAKAGEVNTLSINAEGDKFVTGGADKIVKIWDYAQGTVDAIGLGHSGNVMKSKFSPDGKHIVSIGDEGGIFIWKVPDGDNNETGNETSNYDTADVSHNYAGNEEHPDQ